MKEAVRKLGDPEGLLTIGLAAVAAVAIAGAPAMAQHGDDYETGYAADADGEIITGQQGYYIPVPDSNDGLVFTYNGNTLGIPDNPSGGGENFVGSVGGEVPDPDGQPFARSQKDVSYDPGAGKGVVTISYDMLVTKIGDTVTNQNVGSFSTQTVPGGSVFGHIDLVTWLDPNDTNAGWTGAQVWYNETNGQVNEQVPEFGTLEIDHWYRRCTTLDLNTNAITLISLTDLETNVTISVVPVDRYAVGGPNNGTTPTGFRYFAGCSTGTCTGGNTIAWDNLVICVAANGDVNFDGCVDFDDLLLVLSKFGSGGPEGDSNCDGVVDFDDVLIVLSNWSDKGECG